MGELIVPLGHRLLGGEDAVHAAILPVVEAESQQPGNFSLDFENRVRDGELLLEPHTFASSWRTLALSRRVMDRSDAARCCGSVPVAASVHGGPAWQLPVELAHCLAPCAHASEVLLGVRVVGIGAVLLVRPGGELPRTRRPAWDAADRLDDRASHCLVEHVVGGVGDERARPDVLVQLASRCRRGASAGVHPLDVGRSDHGIAAGWAHRFTDHFDQ